jgi:hypothetical protein
LIPENCFEVKPVVEWELLSTSSKNLDNERKPIQRFMSGIEN